MKHQILRMNIKRNICFDWLGEKIFGDWEVKKVNCHN